MTAPSWARVPTRKPIFSLLFMENVPTSHTDKLFGWLFKGSINNLFWWGWYCSPSLMTPRGHQDTPFLALGSCEQERREAGGIGPETPCPWMGQHCILGKSLHSQPCVPASHTIKQEPKTPLSPSEAQNSRKKGAQGGTYKASPSSPVQK